MIEFKNVPPQIAMLPRDDRGYPVPWFVETVNGKPDFRIMSSRNLGRAIREKLCWVCGGPLDLKKSVFVIGPMCAINRTSAEPPSHEDCAEFSAIHCPFLSKPKAVRREANLPPGGECAGIGLTRNPGVTLLWHCNGYRLMQVSNGVLFKLPNPSKVRWFREGRKATRDEIMESINTGLPLLREMAEEEGSDAVAALERMTATNLKYVPAT